MIQGFYNLKIIRNGSAILDSTFPNKVLWSGIDLLVEGRVDNTTDSVLSHLMFGTTHGDVTEHTTAFNGDLAYAFGYNNVQFGQYQTNVYIDHATHNFNSFFTTDNTISQIGIGSYNNDGTYQLFSLTNILDADGQLLSIDIIPGDQVIVSYLLIMRTAVGVDKRNVIHKSAGSKFYRKNTDELPQVVVKPNALVSGIVNNMGLYVAKLDDYYISLAAHVSYGLALEYPYVKGTGIVKMKETLSLAAEAPATDVALTVTHPYPGGIMQYAAGNDGRTYVSRGQSVNMYINMALIPGDMYWIYQDETLLVKPNYFEFLSQSLLANYGNQFNDRMETQGFSIYSKPLNRIAPLYIYTSLIVAPLSMCIYRTDGKIVFMGMSDGKGLIQIKEVFRYDIAAPIQLTGSLTVTNKKGSREFPLLTKTERNPFFLFGLGSTVNKVPTASFRGMLDPYMPGTSMVMTAYRLNGGAWLTEGFTVTSDYRYIENTVTVELLSGVINNVELQFTLAPVDGREQETIVMVKSFPNVKPLDTGLDTTVAAYVHPLTIDIINGVIIETAGFYYPEEQE